MTDGRTGGGGTGSAHRIIQSGRTNLTLNPMTAQSSSLMRFRISYAFVAVSSCGFGVGARVGTLGCMVISGLGVQAEQLSQHVFHYPGVLMYHT